MFVLMCSKFPSTKFMNYEWFEMRADRGDGAEGQGVRGALHRRRALLFSGVSGVQGAECRVQGAGCRVQGAGCRVQGAGCRVQGAPHRTPPGRRAPSGRCFSRPSAPGPYFSMPDIRQEGSKGKARFRRCYARRPAPGVLCLPRRARIQGA